MENETEEIASPNINSEDLSKASENVNSEDTFENDYSYNDYNASVFRKKARQDISVNGWFSAVSGNMLILLPLLICGYLFSSICFSQLKGLYDSGIFPNILSALSDEEMASSLIEPSLTFLVFITLIYFFAAVYRYSIATWAIAVVRGGASFGHWFSGFGKGWRTLWLMSLTEMYIFLWTLMLIIPGIRAFYSYRMVYFLRVDHPEFSATQIIGISAKMMHGHRWQLFKLDLSFIGWIILTVLISLIPGMTYLAQALLSSYSTVSHAEFYEQLLDEQL